jgi:hypothetical protein
VPSLTGLAPFPTVTPDFRPGLMNAVASRLECGSFHRACMNPNRRSSARRKAAHNEQKQIKGE